MGWRFLDSARQAIDRWLFREYATAPEQLAAYRIIYAAIAMVIFWQRAVWAAEVPHETWAPWIIPTRLLSGPPSAFILQSLNAALTLSLASLLIGFQTPIASIAAACLMIALNSVAYAFGKIDHDVMMIAVPISLAFSGWGGRFSIDSYRKPDAEVWPSCIAILSLLLGVGMLTAAWPKIAAGWLEPGTQVVRNIISQTYHGGAVRPLAAESVLAIRSPVFWEAQDWVTIIAELAFIFTIWNRTAFRITCAIMCLLHLGILFTLDIRHPFNMVAYAAFFPMFTVSRRAYLWLPVGIIATFLLNPWEGFQEFTLELVVICGGILACAYLVGLVLSAARGSREDQSGDKS